MRILLNKMHLTYIAVPTRRDVLDSSEIHTVPIEFCNFLCLKELSMAGAPLLPPRFHYILDEAAFFVKT